MKRRAGIVILFLLATSYLSTSSPRDDVEIDDDARNSRANPSSRKITYICLPVAAIAVKSMELTEQPTYFKNRLPDIKIDAEIDMEEIDRKVRYLINTVAYSRDHRLDRTQTITLSFGDNTRDVVFARIFYDERSDAIIIRGEDKRSRDLKRKVSEAEAATRSTKSTSVIMKGGNTKRQVNKTNCP